MPRLIMTHEGAVIREFDLNKERMTVGRKPHCEIHLEDPTVSGEHAVFLNLQHVYVEDLGSTNGVVLNGKRISKRQLNHGDLIRIGRHEFKYIDDRSQKFDQTVVIAGEGQQPAQSAQPAAAHLVRVMNGPKQGEEIALSKSYTTLGSPGVQVAVIARRGGSYFLMPMTGVGNTKPPLLNDESIGSETKPLQEGDVIEVAGTRLQFAAAE